MGKDKDDDSRRTFEERFRHTTRHLACQAKRCPKLRNTKYRILVSEVQEGSGEGSLRVFVYEYVLTAVCVMIVIEEGIGGAFPPSYRALPPGP